MNEFLGNGVIFLKKFCNLKVEIWLEVGLNLGQQSNSWFWVPSSSKIAMHAEEKCNFCNGWCKLGDYLESELEGVTIKEMRQWLRKSVSIQQSKQLPT